MSTYIRTLDPAESHDVGAYLWGIGAKVEEVDLYFGPEFQLNTDCVKAGWNHINAQYDADCKRVEEAGALPPEDPFID